MYLVERLRDVARIVEDAPRQANGLNEDLVWLSNTFANLVVGLLNEAADSIERQEE